MSAEQPFSSQPLSFTERRKSVHKQLEAAQILSDALFQHTEVDVLVVKALRIALDVIGAEAGSVLLADAQKKELIFRHSIGVKPVLYGTAIPWDQGIAGAVFQSGQPAVVGEVKKDARHFSGIDEGTGFETRNMMTIR